MFFYGRKTRPTDPGEENFPYFYQGGLYYRNFFTAELSHFLGQKKSKKIFRKFRKFGKKFRFFFF